MQVNYVGKAANLYEDAGYQLSGSSYVVNKLLGTTWLWDRIRVVGGAYGGFSDFDSHSGAAALSPVVWRSTTQPDVAAEHGGFRTAFDTTSAPMESLW